MAFSKAAAGVVQTTATLRSTYPPRLAAGISTPPSGSSKLSELPAAIVIGTPADDPLVLEWSIASGSGSVCRSYLLDDIDRRPTRWRSSVCGMRIKKPRQFPGGVLSLNAEEFRGVIRELGRGGRFRAGAFNDRLLRDDRRAVGQGLKKRRRTTAHKKVRIRRPTPEPPTKYKTTFDIPLVYGWFDY